MSIELTTSQWMAAASAVGIWTLVGVVAYALLTSGKRTSAGDGMWLVRKIAGEPVVFASVAASVSSALVVFGLDLGTEETGVVIGAIVTVCTWLARRKSTPVAGLPSAPQDAEHDA